MILAVVNAIYAIAKEAWKKNQIPLKSWIIFSGFHNCIKIYVTGPGALKW